MRGPHRDHNPHTAAVQTHFATNALHVIRRLALHFHLTETRILSDCTQKISISFLRIKLSHHYLHFIGMYSHNYSSNTNGHSQFKTISKTYYCSSLSFYRKHFTMLIHSFTRVPRRFTPPVFHNTSPKSAPPYFTSHQISSYNTGFLTYALRGVGWLVV